MKLLIVGSKQSYALESFYNKHLKELGCNTITYPTADIFQRYYSYSIFNKVKFRIGVSSILKKINKDLIKKVEELHPNWVLVFKGMEIFPETIDTIKGLGILTANYNPDHPFVFHGRGSGNKNVSNGIKKYHLHLTYNLSVKVRIENEMSLPCEWLPFGFEPSKLELPSETEEIKRLCFIGFADKQRANSIKELLDSGIPVDVYGPNWPRYFKPSSKLKIFPAVFNDEFAQTASRYRVQLNLFRPHNESSHNMRSFEMPGIGCIMLAPASQEHNRFFEEDKEIFCFDTPRQMVTAAKKILSLPYEQALGIRKNALSRSHKSQYDYRSRASQLLTNLTNFSIKIT